MRGWPVLVHQLLEKDAFLQPGLVHTRSLGLADTLRFPPLVTSQGLEFTSGGQMTLAL